jgi:hypothetical protein
MPSRAFYHQTLDGCLSNVSGKSQDQVSELTKIDWTKNVADPYQFPFPPTLPSSNEFVENNFDLDMNEWNEYMKWETPTTDARGLLDRQYSSGQTSSRSSYPQIDSNFNQMAIDDAPFELDESSNIPELDLELSSPDSPPHHTHGQGRHYPNYSSLTDEQQRELLNIAMPHRTVIQTPSESAHSPSPSSIEVEETKSTPTRSRKRKSSTKSQAEDTESGNLSLCQSRKRGHNAIEKRYRTNLNEKIVILRQSIPSLRVLPEGEIDDAEEDDASCEKEKYGKAAILSRAVEYISHLENSTERMGREAVVLKARVAAFEKLAMSGSFQMGCGPTTATVSSEETLESIKAGKSHRREFSRTGH